MKKGNTNEKCEFPLTFPKLREDWPSSSEEDRSDQTESQSPNASYVAMPNLGPDFENFVPPFPSGDRDDHHPAHLGPMKQLYCRTGFNLAINSNGKVYGERALYSDEAILELSPTDEYGEVKIKGVKSGLYIGMDERGRLYGETDPIAENIVFHESFQDGYNSYLSKAFESKKWFLAIKKSGKPKRGDKTAQGQKATQFIPRQANPP